MTSTPETTEKGTTFVNLNEIDYDPTFNCRVGITPISVIELKEDMDSNGLLNAVVVRKHPDPDSGYPYQLVAGYRRTYCAKLLGWERIEVKIKELNDLDAKFMNLSENVTRKQLNIWEEAKAIESLVKLGITNEVLSSRLGVSTHWVHIRKTLLDLPDEIQAEAAAGFISQPQIEACSRLKTKEEQFDFVIKIKEAKLRGEKIHLPCVKPQSVIKKNHQRPAEIQRIMDWMGENIGYGLHTRSLAWAKGEINEFELFRDIQAFAKEHDLQVVLPDEIARLEGMFKAQEA
jgi:ParB/RepB/Spo0J family partition protein